MYKKRNGFTLVELLVTIALIISILLLAIISVINISNKQKENAFEKVKQQVETAAEQYFESNEYLFEDLTENGFGIIPVGKLVKEDYLNKLTNPVTGRPLNECDKVKVQRSSDGKFKISYIGVGDEYCFSSDSILIQSSPKSPSIDLKFVGMNTKKEINKGNDNWINYEELGISDNGVFVKIDTKADNVRYCVTSAQKCKDENDLKQEGIKSISYSLYDTISYVKDTAEKQVCYVAENAYGYSTRCIMAGVDTQKPSCVLKSYGHVNDNSYLSEFVNVISSNKNTFDPWYASDVNISFAKYEDSSDYVYDFKGSGLGTYYIDEKQEVIEPNNNANSITLTSDTTSTGKKYYGHVIDKAGNTNRCEITVKRDATKPTCPENLLTYSYATNSNNTITKNSHCNPEKSQNRYFCASVKATLTKADDWKYWKFNGHNNSTLEIYRDQSIYSPEIVVYDEHGNFNTCYGKSFVIDTTKPTVSVEFLNITDNTKWYNYTVKYKATAEDELSGIGSITHHWNKSGLTPTTVNNSSYSYNTTSNSYSNGGKDDVDVVLGAKTIYNESYLSAEGYRKMFYNVCDQAGNCVNSPHNDVKIDKTAPVITNIQKPIHSTSYCRGSKAIYTSFDVNDKLSGVDRVDHFMDNKKNKDWYKKYEYSNIASSLSNPPKISEIVSLISIYNGASTKTQSIFEYSSFSTNDGKIGVRTISDTGNGPGFNINRAWSYDSAETAKSKGCGTISSSGKRPGDSISSYCNFVAAKDAAGNKSSAKICNDGTDVRK